MPSVDGRVTQRHLTRQRVAGATRLTLATTTTLGTDAARDDPVEDGTERRAEHGVDDRIGQRRRPAEPDEGRHGGRAERLQTAVADHRQHVDDEERRPEQQEDGEDDAEDFGRSALLADDRAAVFEAGCCSRRNIERRVCT